MIVYKRLLKKEDVQGLNKDEQLIYYYSDNIAYTVNPMKKGYAVRRKKVFNNQITEDKTVKTISQVLKIVE